MDVNEVFLSTASFGQVHHVHTNGAVSRESVRLADPTLHLNRWLDLHFVTDRQSITPRQPSFWDRCLQPVSRSLGRDGSIFRHLFHCVHIFKSAVVWVVKMRPVTGTMADDWFIRPFQGGADEQKENAPLTASSGLEIIGGWLKLTKKVTHWHVAIHWFYWFRRT